MVNKKFLSELFEVFVSNALNWPKTIETLADELGISTDSLLKLGIGINPLAGTYVIPERDNQGNIIGLAQRFFDGKKMMIKGSKRGLVYELNPEFLKGEKQYEPGKHNWTRIYEAGVSCPICGKPDWCLVSARNPHNPPAVVCSRISKGSRFHIKGCGFLHILDPKGEVRSGSQGALLETNKPVIVVEGYSDTAAATDLGFVAVGRPSAESGLELLPDLVRGKEVIIVGDNDAGVGQRGMETTFRALSPVCSKVTKVLPPKQFKDLRQWKNQISLNEQTFLKWVEEQGDKSGNPNIFESDVAHTIAKTWLDQEKRQDGFPTVRCYHGQWVEYKDGYYANCDKEEFRGQIYQFLDGKLYPKLGTKGEVNLVPYRPTRAKVSDIVDALSNWCTITEDPPVWLKKMDRPDPVDLIAFRNGILDVQKYLQGEIKVYDPTPALFSFNILPYDFDEDARSDFADDLFKELFNGNKDQIELLAQWMGYNCTPDMSYEKLMLCTGRPRSGKGTILNALAAMLGKHQCVSTSFQTLCTEFGYQPLIGKLAVILSDAKVPKQREAEAALEKILQIVGRDPVGIRRMYLPYLPQIYLKCRFTIAMNDLPNLPDQANALEPKLNALKFPNSYVNREDISIKFKLQEEARTGKLINFALQGLKSLRQNGKFIVPRSTASLLRQLRELTTPVTAFIADCCELEPPGSSEDYYVIIDELYEAWERWCQGSGRKNPGTKAQFGRWFTTACPTAITTRLRLEDRRHRIYRKVRLANWVYRQWMGINKKKKNA